jgi:hypothetical protein
VKTKTRLKARGRSPNYLSEEYEVQVVVDLAIQCRIAVNLTCTSYTVPLAPYARS